MKITKTKCIQGILLAVASIIIIVGLLFLLTVAEIAPIFKFVYNISNIIGRYVIVIVTMAIGIMMFSNVASFVENEKQRKSLTIGITTFSTILTVPLVYVFIAIFFAQNGIIGPVGSLMMLDQIVLGFEAIFGVSSGLYIIYILLFIMSVVFILFPLITGILTVRGQSIKIGKQENGKFGIALVDLPIIAKQKKQQND